MALRTLSWVALPIVLLGLVAAAFLSIDPLRPFTASAPPIETVTVERTVLDGDGILLRVRADGRSEEHTSELQSLMRISYAVFCLQQTNRKLLRLTQTNST